MNLPTLIISALVALAFFAVIFRGIRNKRKGRSSCSCCSSGCGSCGLNNSCHQ